jgi:Ca2+-transporting ATPase
LSKLFVGEHKTIMAQAPVSLSGIYCILEGAQVLHGLQSSESHGLDDDEASQRLSEMGHNSIPTKAPESFASKVWDQINNPLILLLLGSACLSLLLGHVDDAVSIALAVLIVSTGESLPWETSHHGLIIYRHK